MRRRTGHSLCSTHERRTHIGAISSSRSRLRAPELLSRLRPTDARSAVVTLLFDVALVAITVVVKVVLLIAMGADAGFTIYVPAVAIAAWYRGLLGGILATFLSALFDTPRLCSGADQSPGRRPRPAGSAIGVRRRWRGGLRRIGFERSVIAPDTIGRAPARAQRRCLRAA